MCAGAGRRSRFRREVPEGSGGSGEFRRVAESSGEFWRWCRFRKQVPEGSGGFRQVPVCAGVGSGGKFRKVPEGSGACWCRFRRVPARAGVGSGGRFRSVPARAGVGSEAGFRRFQGVPVRQPSQEQPCDCFARWLVITLST